MPTLPTHPPDFVPGVHFTQERVDLDPANWLWPDKLKLRHWLVHVHELAFAWDATERTHLVDAILEDRPELIQQKEEWVRDWTKLVQELSDNTLNCKTYNMNLPLSSDEVALDRKAEEANKLYAGQIHAYKSKERQMELAKEKGKEKEKAQETDEAMDEADGNADAEGESDEEEADKAPRAVAPVVHPVPCARCIKAKKPCVGKPGNSCELCKDARKKCEYSTHRRGVAKKRAAARAVAAKPSQVEIASAVKAPSAPAPSSSVGWGVLIRHPRETPEDATTANSEGEEEEEEESVEDSRKRKSPDSREVEFDLLADADGDEEDLYLEGKVRALYAKMLTMQGMLMEMMMEVDSLAVRCKKRRRIQ
ncbi:hypothetical protein DFJ58DRAFT_729076 [Suillus subalutaceus]|uniref:uncharacterized protein n=1 Tax=Suillus subalutaceus TaxID=48586 RepID=UPI001B86681B|nr:uncharacterized protein DFJ58DRAFT_729076 [Suillus subalutaceus]KAG1851089.1 hypothetical protein DFJ58DRAFT_729076 [Suillus subalutaceus]